MLLGRGVLPDRGERPHPARCPCPQLETNAKTEVDFIHNFKLLQTAFSKNKIDRAIEVAS